MYVFWQRLKNVVFRLLYNKLVVSNSTGYRLEFTNEGTDCYNFNQNE